MSEPLRFTQKMLQAASNVLWAAGILKPDADPTTVMVACAHMLQAVDCVRPENASQARDHVDPAIVKRIVRA